MQNEDPIITQSNTSTLSIDNASDFDSERKSIVYELTYTAGSFEDVKLSGSYGFSWSMLPWEISPRLYTGIHFSPFNFNYGLNDFNYDEIRLGPAVGYYFTPKIFISAPLDVICDVYFDTNDKTKMTWGMALAPAVYIGNKAGIFVGPQFKFGFSGSSKLFCGFRAGLYL